MNPFIYYGVLALSLFGIGFSIWAIVWMIVQIFKTMNEDSQNDA